MIKYVLRLTIDLFLEIYHYHKTKNIFLDRIFTHFVYEEGAHKYYARFRPNKLKLLRFTNRQASFLANDMIKDLTHEKDLGREP